MVVAKNTALTKKKYNQNETNEKNVYANMHSSDPETSDRLLYILFLFEIKNTANSSLYMNGKSVPSPFLSKRSFCSNETCLTCNYMYMLLFWKHLSHRKTFDSDKLHNIYDSKILCPLSPKSQSMTCFDNSKRAQIKHNKVQGSTNIGRIDEKAEVSQEHDSHYRICLLTRLLSSVFFNPCYNFPFPTRDNVIVIHHFLFHCSKLWVQSFERISVVS